MCEEGITVLIIDDGNDDGIVDIVDWQRFVWLLKFLFIF